MVVTLCGKSRLLDIHLNCALLESLSDRAGGRDRVIVVYEKQKKNRIFGVKGNFANGRHEEFWRVLLTLEGFKFTSVDPNTWQGNVLQGITGGDPKQRARTFLTQRFPSVQLQHKPGQQEAIRDAMCLAFWGRTNAR